MNFWEIHTSLVIWIIKRFISLFYEEISWSQKSNSIGWHSILFSYLWVPYFCVRIPFLHLNSEQNRRRGDDLVPVFLFLFARSLQVTSLDVTFPIAFASPETKFGRGARRSRDWNKINIERNWEEWIDSSKWLSYSRQTFFSLLNWFCFEKTLFVGLWCLMSINKSVEKMRKESASFSISSDIEQKRSSTIWWQKNVYPSSGQFLFCARDRVTSITNSLMSRGDSTIYNRNMMRSHWGDNTQ